MGNQFVTNTQKGGFHGQQQTANFVGHGSQFGGSSASPSPESLTYACWYADNGLLHM
ncbi:hypothetical protein Syun_012723 [Stephania yunnanensis]|uniref:Uncharacterized protein n=1 Tax=Stephania yunnanensis TaxID=152371 RepID=A0AAP0JZX8_9MAGN